MVSTRTQTKTIPVTKYDYATLKEKGEKRRVKKRRTEQKLGTSSETPQPLIIDENFFGPEWKLPEPKTVTVDDHFFWPDVVIGEEPKEGLSKLSRAELRVRQWESILKVHEEKLPDAVIPCRVMLHKAKKDLEFLQLDPANAIKVDEQGRAQVIEDRIKALQYALITAEHVPEKENIQGAIDAYQSGEIKYGKEFTLIWGGKVVDQAESYASFTEDRLERLDRYAEKYGPHWLWWESPLWLEPSAHLRAAGCQIVDRISAPHGFGHFFINQGFWKRSGWVTRMPESSGFEPSPDIKTLTDVGDATFCQCEGPKVTIQSLLDSGASYPSLYQSDFQALGILKSNYGAQSLVKIGTANGLVDRRVYEVHVEIAGNPGTLIIDPNNPVNPAYPRYVGGLSPVIFDEAEPIPDENGGIVNGRLSGIMPFLAPYLSITPSRNTVLLGEDRNDVLGAHKMPPTRRWMVGLDQDPTSRAHWPNFQEPLVCFSHRRGLLVDQDLSPGVSKLTANVGLWNETSHVNDPRGAFQNQAVVDPTVMLPTHNPAPGN